MSALYFGEGSGKEGYSLALAELIPDIWNDISVSFSLSAARPKDTPPTITSTASMPSSAREGMLTTVIVVLQIPILSFTNSPLNIAAQKTRKNETECSFFYGLLTKAYLLLSTMYSTNALISSSLQVKQRPLGGMLLMPAIAFVSTWSMPFSRRAVHASALPAPTFGAPAAPLLWHAKHETM